MVKSYFIKDDQLEVYPVGALVCVCVPTRLTHDIDRKYIDGREYKAEIPFLVPIRAPYIDFLSIRFDSDGSPYIDEDRTIRGVTANEALRLIEELKIAVETLDEIVVNMEEKKEWK